MKILLQTPTLAHLPVAACPAMAPYQLAPEIEKVTAERAPMEGRSVAF